METKFICKAVNLESWVKSAIISEVLGTKTSCVKLEVRYIEGGVEFPFSQLYPGEKSAKISFAKRFHKNVRWTAEVEENARN
ncbi:MAG: hypothetical protein PHN44_00575 [Candidatus Marinimicrobia bacterium]|nr:hypothetical protein [Candidatus Neomarinimicrobiota bacterium]MDD5539140.1 hypothetical protein [Candidatus Neomarinimicrobiota bacterium]